MSSTRSTDDAQHGGEAVVRIDATVFASVMEFELVLVRTHDGYQYALTRQTVGVLLEDLREGQRVSCLVTRRMPRVLAATVL